MNAPCEDGVREMSAAKYPRTPHLPFSPGVHRDDRQWAHSNTLVGRSVVVTEKLDGSGVCLAAENLYARSRASSPNHPSFAALWPVYHQVRAALVHREHLSLFGEWCFAVHAVWYPQMPVGGWLRLFAVRDERDQSWLSFNQVREVAAVVGVPVVPVDAEVVVESAQHLEEVVLEVAGRPSAFGPVREGVVVRNADGFSDEEFGENVAKWVRRDHVAGEHWSRFEPRRHDLWRPENNTEEVG